MAAHGRHPFGGSRGLLDDPLREALRRPNWASLGDVP
jgi:hypothetical protein